MAVIVTKTEKTKSLENAIDSLKVSEKYLIGSLNFVEGVIRHQDMNKYLWEVQQTMKYLSPAISTLENLLRKEEGEQK